MTTDALHDQLKALLLAASAAAAERVRSHDASPLRLVRKTYVKQDEDGNGWQSFTRDIEKNVLADPNLPPFRYAPLLTPDVAEMASHCAERLVQLPGARLPFFSPWNYPYGWMLTHEMPDKAPPVPEYEEDPALWTLGHLLLRALYDHLRALPRLDAVSSKAAESFATEVIEFTRSERLAYKVTIPLAGIALAASRKDGLKNGDATVYPLSQEERGNLLEAWGIGAQNPFLELPTASLSLRVEAPRMAQFPDTRAEVNAWLCSFYLHGYTLVGREVRTEASPSWAGIGISRVPLRMLEHTRGSRPLTPTTFEKVRKSVDKLRKYSIGEPTSAHDFALHRFHLGAARLSSADAVVDFVVALESLLLPYDSDARHGDLGYRFRMHGAHYLAKTKGERPKIVKQLTMLYGLRSKLVHGGKYPTPADIEEGRKVGGELARVGLLRAVEEGFPRPETFKRMLLGTWPHERL
ncbi:hypothetical protein ABZ517_10745 [Streptomyces scabiei]|uniref:hypothetical protein n=1 Tax=Streptomyces scabiei TaxID=1930 RepID=UPI0033F5783D